MTSPADTTDSRYREAGDDTPETFVKALKDGDESAWQKLARIWGDTLLGFCRRRGFRPHDAEEVAQNVLVKMYRGIQRFERDGERLKLRHWVFDIARKEADSHRRRYLDKPASPGGEQPAVVDPIAVDDPDEQQSFETLLMAQILRVIEPDFSPQVWKAFWGYAVEQRPGPEVAAELGMQPNAVRQAADRVKRRIRAELDGFQAE